MRRLFVAGATLTCKGLVVQPGISPLLRVMHRGMATVCMLVVAVLALGQSDPRSTPEATPTKPGPRQVLPLDPLGPEELRVAERIALADPRVREQLGTGRRELVSVDVFVPKPAQKEIGAAIAGQRIHMGRFAEVVFFRYEGEYGVRAVVDLEGKAVTEVTRLESRQVPMTPTDLGDAWRLALRNEDVRKALGPNVERFQVWQQARAATAGRSREAYVVEALRVGAAEEKDPCFKHRCLQLLFRRGDTYLMEPSVIVDLSAEKVYVERRRP